VLSLKAGRRHNQRTRDWRIGHLITALKDKAEAAGISLTLVDERGTSSTCPPVPAGSPNRRAGLACPACQFTGHRDLSAAATIAARAGGGSTPVIPAGVTHRRAGAHLPGVTPSRRDPRRRAHHRGAAGPLAGTGRPAAHHGRGVARHQARSPEVTHLNFQHVH
jgi:putative transposase